MQLGACALAVACTLAALFAGASCSNAQDIHETSQAKSKACFDCHAAAYNMVLTPVHLNVYPTTCQGCHATTAWVPAAGGHPETKFPITSGSHSTQAIVCSDCHIASLGSDVGGQNTDCVHCHLGAHETPAIDAAHTKVANYSGSMPTSPPTCLNAGCHPSG